MLHGACSPASHPLLPRSAGPPWLPPAWHYCTATISSPPLASAPLPGAAIACPSSPGAPITPTSLARATPSAAGWV